MVSISRTWPAPKIQIRQQRGELGFDADIGTQDIQQPKATYEMKYVHPQLEIRSPKGDLRIDSEKAWDALAKGGTLKTFHRVYSWAKEAGLEGIANRVERGNRLAAIQEGGNAIADIGEERVEGLPSFAVVGPASIDNVDIHYTAGTLEIQVNPGTVQVNTHPNPPIIGYTRGKLDMYMLHYPKVTIIPPQIEARI